MAENKDLGGALSALDMDRIYDDSVSVTVPFSIKRQAEDDKSAAIKGNLEFNFAGYSQRSALTKACQQLKVDWANGIRVKQAWVGPVPKVGETIPIKVATYFAARTKSAPLTPANLLAQFNGDVEAAKAALDAAAEANNKAEKDAGITHVSPEEHEKSLAEKREKYLADQAEGQAKIQAKLDADKAAEEEASKKRKAKTAKGKK